jgi:hypothetical protein
MQVDKEGIDSRTLRMTERKGDRKILYACRLTERGETVGCTQDDSEKGRQEDTVCMQGW